jgi:FixJ family two-component response regulator
VFAVQDLAEGGPDAFLAKPFTRTEILECLAQIVRNG